MTASTSAMRREWAPPCGPASSRVRIDLYGAGSISVRRECADAFRALSACLQAHGYQTRRNDTGAYNCRAITGGTGYSLHAYGIAADINWQTNPYGKPLRTDMSPAMIADIKKIRTRNGVQVFRWGGDYTGNKDAMHFEVVCTKADLATGIAGHPQTPAVAWTPFHLGDTDKSIAARHGEPYEVTEAQLELAAVAKKWGDARLDPGKPDGSWGRASVAAWVAFQRRIVTMQAAQAKKDPAVKVWTGIDGNVTRAKIDILRWWSK